MFFWLNFEVIYNACKAFKWMNKNPFVFSLDDDDDGRGGGGEPTTQRK